MSYHTAFTCYPKIHVLGIPLRHLILARACEISIMEILRLRVQDESLTHGQSSNTVKSLGFLAASSLRWTQIDVDDPKVTQTHLEYRTIYLGNQYSMADSPVADYQPHDNGGGDQKSGRTSTQHAEGSFSRFDIHLKGKV